MAIFQVSSRSVQLSGPPKKRLLILGPHLKGEPYTNEERTTLATLAPQVAPALRVAQMVQAQQAQMRERERIEQELRTAQLIQRSLLPEALPELSGW